MLNTKGQRIKGSNGRAERVRLFLFVLLCSFVSLPLCVEDSFSAQTQAFIRWIPAEGGKMAVEIVGLNSATLQQLAKWNPQQLQRLLSVYAGKENANLP